MLKYENTTCKYVFEVDDIVSNQMNFGQEGVYDIYQGCAPH